MRYLPSFPVTSTLVVTSLASDNHLLGAITWMPEGRSDELFDTWLQQPGRSWGVPVVNLREAPASPGPRS